MESGLDEKAILNGMAPNSLEKEGRTSPTPDRKEQTKMINDYKKQTELETSDISMSTNRHPVDFNDDKEMVENEQIKELSRQSTVVNENRTLELHRIDQSSDSGLVYLPRLAGSSFRMCHDNKHSSGKENLENKVNNENGNQLRLPDIHVACSRTSRVALNRSITDLLDPEMEILNKIKRGPRKKRKKRKMQTVQNDSLIDDVF